MLRCHRWTIYHMKRVMEEIRAGNTKQRVHLRPKDEFQDVARAFFDGAPG